MINKNNGKQIFIPRGCTKTCIDSQYRYCCKTKNCNKFKIKRIYDKVNIYIYIYIYIYSTIIIQIR